MHHILLQNVKYGTFVTNVTKISTYALWGNNSGSNSLRGGSASCAGLIHRNTNTQIHEHTNTQINKYTKTQIQKGRVSPEWQPPLHVPSSWLCNSHLFPGLLGFDEKSMLFMSLVYFVPPRKESFRIFKTEQQRRVPLDAPQMHRSVQFPAELCPGSKSSKGFFFWDTLDT